MKKKIQRTTQIALVVCMVLNLCALSSFVFKREPAADLSHYDREQISAIELTVMYRYGDDLTVGWAQTLQNYGFIYE